MKSYTLDQKANHLLDYWEWDKENNSDDSKKLRRNLRGVAVIKKDYVYWLEKRSKSHRSRIRNTKRVRMPTERNDEPTEKHVNEAHR